VHLIGDELWGGYPAWRRANGAGRHKRNGVREVSDDMAQAFADNEAERRTKVQQTRRIKDADIRFRIKHDVPVFNHPFREVGREYLQTQEERAKCGEISAARPKKVRAIIEGAL
jgi:hypothetical protein